MYVRAVVPTIDRDSYQRQGVFIAAGDLLDNGWLTEGDSDRLADMIAWFNRSVRVPRRKRWKRKAIFWFKESNPEWEDRLHELAAFLTRWFDRVDLLETCKPGYVVYEDDIQVAAI